MSSSNSSANKTEKPTPKRLADARKKGQVPRSREIVSAFIMLSLTLLSYLAAPTFFEWIKSAFIEAIDISTRPFTLVIDEIALQTLKLALMITAPVLLLVCIVVFVGSIAQGGFVFAIDQVKPKMENISIKKGLKRIFSMKSLVELIKSVVKAIILSVLIYYLVYDNLKSLFYIPRCGLKCALEAWGIFLLMLFAYSTAIYIAVSIFDAYFQHRSHIKSLMMTLEEVKRDYKETEGNQEVKATRTSLYQEIISESLMSDVKRATAVVMNPTHIAVGLYYKKGKTPLPIILFKELDHVALAIKKVAKVENVPVVQNIPLARALFDKGKRYDRIPGDLIEAVAEVIRFVTKLQNKD